jgi:AraC family transcriptional regulator, transcriptional activator of pobA
MMFCFWKKRYFCTQNLPILTTKIKRFAEINEFFQTTGFDKRTDINDFFIFTFDELPTHSAFKMPPYQKDFYQVSLIIRSDNSTLSINQQSNKGQQNVLYFLSPEHIFSWQRDTVTKGFICYFKAAFLDFFNGNITRDFSFFDLTSHNILTLQENQAAELTLDFEKIYREFYTPNNYRVQVLQSLLLSLLFKLKNINEAYSTERSPISKKQDLLLRFKNLVNNCYLTQKQVSDYAAKLFVTANYLNECVKEQTGKTAKEIITEKIIIEAKKALQFSDDDVAQVAYNLGFDEPTNFIRFFKAHTSMTPKAFKNSFILAKP